MRPDPPGGVLRRDRGSTRIAKRIYGAREVRTQCLSHALAADEHHGVWGGLSERERRHSNALKLRITTPLVPQHVSPITLIMTLVQFKRGVSDYAAPGRQLGPQLAGLTLGRGRRRPITVPS